jgi:hypothetical protein
MYLGTTVYGILLVIHTSTPESMAPLKSHFFSLIFAGTISKPLCLPRPVSCVINKLQRGLPTLTKVALIFHGFSTPEFMPRKRGPNFVRIQVQNRLIRCSERGKKRGREGSLTLLFFSSHTSTLAAPYGHRTSP